MLTKRTRCVRAASWSTQLRMLNFPRYRAVLERYFVDVGTCGSYALELQRLWSSRRCEQRLDLWQRVSHCLGRFWTHSSVIRCAGNQFGDIAAKFALGARRRRLILVLQGKSVRPLLCHRFVDARRSLIFSILMQHKILDGPGAIRVKCDLCVDDLGKEILDPRQRDWQAR